MNPHSQRILTIAIIPIILGVFAVSLLGPTIAAVPAFAQSPDLPGNTLPTEGPQTTQARAQQLEWENARGYHQTTSPADTTKPVSCALTNITCGVLKALNWLVDMLGSILLYFAKGFFAYTLTLNLDAFKSGTTSSGAALSPFLPAATIGWKIILGVVNVFFALWLLWIAIATIFDIPGWGKELIPKVIIAALLINFSFVIGTSFIRLSNEIGTVFFRVIEKNMGGISAAIETMTNVQPTALTTQNTSQMSTAEAQRHLDYTIRVEGITMTGKTCYELLTKGRMPDLYFTGSINEVKRKCLDVVTAQDINQAYRVVVTEDVQEQVLAAGVIVKIIIYPITFLTLIVGGIAMVVRLVNLLLLLVFAPIAFASYAIPQLGEVGRGGWGKWWGDLSKWCFFLPSFLFMFMLSLIVLKYTGAGIGTISLATGGKLAPGPVAIFVNYLLGIILMFFALGTANAAGGKFSNKVVGWGKKLNSKAGSWLRGTGKIAGGKLAGAALGTRAGQALASSKYTRWAMAPFEAATVAGQKTRETRDKKSRERQAAAAKTSDSYRWALMDGMLKGKEDSRLADFIRDSKPHHLKGALKEANSDQRIDLKKRMEKYDLDDKVVDAVEDLTHAVEMISGVSSRNAMEFQNAFTSWMRGAPNHEIQKRVSANDIFNAETGVGNTFLQNILRDEAAAQDPKVVLSTLKVVLNTQKKSEALGSLLIEQAPNRDEIHNLLARGAYRHEIMKSAIGEIIASGEKNPLYKLVEKIELDPSAKIAVTRGIALGKKAQKFEATTEEAVPSAAPATTAASTAPSGAATP